MGKSRNFEIVWKSSEKCVERKWITFLRNTNFSGGPVRKAHLCTLPYCPRRPPLIRPSSHPHTITILLVIIITIITIAQLPHLRGGVGAKATRKRWRRRAKRLGEWHISTTIHLLPPKRKKRSLPKPKMHPMKCPIHT